MIKKETVVFWNIFYAVLKQPETFLRILKSPEAAGAGREKWTIKEKG